MTFKMLSEIMIVTCALGYSLMFLFYLVCSITEIIIRVAHDKEKFLSQNTFKHLLQWINSTFCCSLLWLLVYIAK